MNHFTSQPSATDGATSLSPEVLTPRRRQAVSLVAGGKTYVKAAQEMKCSPRTVESHVRQVMMALDIHNRAALTRYAVREGLVAGI
jgi:DNA-binding NarL/FixJ family response regulator